MVYLPNEYLPVDAAERVHEILAALWERTQFSQRKLMVQARIHPKRRHSLSRQIHGPKSRLLAGEAFRLVKAAAAHQCVQARFQELWAYIVGSASKLSAELCELVAGRTHYPHDSEAFTALTKKLNNIDRSPNKIMFSVAPLLGALIKPIRRCVQHVRTAAYGRLGIDARSILNAYGDTRFELRKELDQMDRTHLYLASNLCHLRDGTGPFAGLAPRHAGEGIEYLADDIIQHGEKVGIIYDSHLTEELRQYLIACEGVFITGNSFLMKIYRHGLYRVSVENRDPLRQSVIDYDRSMLDALKGCVRHDWDEIDMVRELHKFRP